MGRGEKKRRENNYLLYSNWRSVRWIPLMHRHLRHPTCNLKAITICWGCTCLITPYSLRGLRGRCVVLQLGPLQNPAGRHLSGEEGGSTMAPLAQDASGNHRHWHLLSLANDRSSATHFCWLTNSNLICRTLMLQVHLKMTHTILPKWAAYLWAFIKGYYPTNVHINPREKCCKKSNQSRK